MAGKISINDTVFNVDQDVLSKHSDYFKALFNPMFTDSNKEIITIKDIVDADNFQLILNYCQSGHLDLNRNLPELINLLETAQALAFDEASKLCVQELHRRTLLFDNITDFCDVLKVAEVLSVKQLFFLCLERLALNFDTIDQDYFASCCFSEETVIALIGFAQLSCAKDSNLLNLINKWTEKRQISTRLYNAIVTSQMSIVEERLWTLNSNCTYEEKEFLNKTIVNLKSLRNESCQIKDLEPAFQSSFRSNWPNLCLLGTALRCEPNSIQDIICYSFNPRLKHMIPQFKFIDNFTGIEQGILKGGSITTVSDGFILAGGEYKYGKNNWNMEIIKYQYSSGNLRRISKLGTLPSPRRHHTAVLIGQCLYLLGGFCRTRVMLTDMLVFHLDSGQHRVIEMPSRGYNIAATVYEGKLVVAMNGSIYVYNNQEENWTHRVVLTRSIPMNVEFHYAFCYENTMYLTCNFQQTVFSTDLSQTDLLEFRQVGKLNNEAQKPCSQGPYLYNLAKSDVLDFDGSGEKVIEKFDVRTGITEEIYKFDLPIPVQDFPVFWLIS